MNKRIFAALLALTMLTSAGCSLATEGTAAGLPVNDQLVGMYITMESETDQIPAWDAEEMGMEPLHSFQSEGKKLFANRVETPDTTDDGVSDPKYSWAFPGDCGMAFATFYESSTDKQGGFWNFISAPEFAGGHKGTYVSEEGTRIEMECTLYVADTVKPGELSLFANPVYQTPDGMLYALGTSPMGSDAATMYGTSQTVSQETEITLADGVKTTGGTVTLHIETVTLPESYVILEMDAQNQVIRTTEYTPEQMPEEFTPGSDTAYLILENRGAEKTVRTVYSPDDEVAVMDTFSPGRFAICIKGYTHIDWEG